MKVLLGLTSHKGKGFSVGSGGMDAVGAELNSVSQRQGKVFSSNTDLEQKARWWQGRKGWKGKKTDAEQQDAALRQNGCFLGSNRNQWFEPYNHQQNFQK